MNSRSLHRFFTAAIAAAVSALSSAPAAAVAPKPDVLLILADDLGFSDLGCYGGEISTPNLDALAARGLRFTQFYNTARCWPSRAALMTGYYPQQVRRDAVPGVPRSGGRGFRPGWAPLLPERLKAAGYRSYHIGKWHIDGTPLAGGFDRSYYLKDQGRFFNPTQHWLDDKPLPLVPEGTDFYATRELADRAIAFLAEHAAEHRDAPFFTYLAFAAPHFPLQAPAGDIAEYAGEYDAGWGAVRDARWARIRSTGLLEGELSAPERDLGPPYDFPAALEVLGPGEVNRPLPWGDLTPVQRRFQADKMEVHAAMVHRMDREIGRVLRQIERMGRLDNTLVIFLSDNGASAEIMVRDDGHDPAAAPGSAASYLCLGPGWSTVCNTPFRRHKTWVHEGGIATPLVVAWPEGIAAAGGLRRAPGHIIDLPATLLDLAGLPAPEAKPAPGRSLRGVLADDTSPARDAPLWWCHEGNRALRDGDWKLVAAKDEPWALYDLATDRAEERDLAGAQPQRVAEMAAEWEAMMAGFAADARE